MSNLLLTKIIHKNNKSKGALPFEDLIQAINDSFKPLSFKLEVGGIKLRNVRVGVSNGEITILGLSGIQYYSVEDIKRWIDIGRRAFYTLE